MKKLVLLFSLIANASIAQYQNVIDTDYPWYSNIIKYKTPTGNGDDIITATSYEIVPVAKNIDFSKQLVFLDDDRVRFIFPNALNKMRKEYGKKQLKHDHSICESIMHCQANDLPEVYVATYSLFLPAYYANIIINFKDKESAFCDYLIDLATVMDVNFYQLTDSNATKFGYYLQQDAGNSYRFILVVR